jgi:hypothetical protein
MAVWLAAAVAACGALFAGASPTGWSPSDLAWSAAFAALVTVAVSRVPPLVWLLVAVATAAVGYDDATVVSLAALAAAVALLVMVLPHRIPTALAGAAAGAMLVNALLRLPDVGRDGTTALVVSLLVVPVLWLAWRDAPPEARAHLRVWATRAGLALGAVTAVCVVIVGALTPTVNDGIDAARSAADRARAGDIDGARAGLDTAAARMGTASGWLRSPLVLPARVVPVLGQQVRAMSTATTDARRLADASREAIAVVDDGGLEVIDGALDLTAVRATVDPLERSVAAMERARANASAVESPWLLPPLASRLAELTADVDDNLPAARRALDGARLADGFLGADGLRRYFIAFTTPAESRFMGGFVAHYAEVEIDQGRMTVTASGHVADFHSEPRAERELVGLDDHMARHGENYFPAYFVENITASPDGPVAAEIARQIVDIATGRQIDVVIIMDPSAVAALGTLNAPIDLDGVGSLDMEGVEQFLLRDQYTRFPDEDEQRAVLDELIDDTLDALLDGDVNLGAMVDRLGPLVEQGRLQVVSFDPDEDAFLRDVGLTRPFIRPGGVELVAVRSANASPNKLDVYLEREIDHVVEVDPDTGELEGTTTIRLTNAAPPGLRGVVSGGWDLPRPGINRQLVSVYTEHQIASLTVDGRPVEPWDQTELGWRVASVFVEIPRGDTQVIEMRWTGRHAPDVDELVVSYQPTVNRDLVHARVTTTGGTVLAEYDGRPEADVRVPFGSR